MALSEDTLSVHISVIPTSDTAVEYDIYRVDAEGEEVLYSQGRGRLVENAEPPVIDLSQLQTLCTRQPLSREAVYAAYDNVGLHYGAGHQGIKALHVGEDDYQRPQVLATLAMPTTAGEFGLHPGLLDSALQASIGLAVEQEAVDGTPLPFALSAITIYRALPALAYAWVRYSEGSSARDTVQKLDITVCDEQGRVCAALKGFSSRLLKSQDLTVAESASTVLLTPRWEPAALAPNQTPAELHKNTHVLLVGGFTKHDAAALTNALPSNMVCQRLVAEGSLSARYTHTSEQVFTYLRTLLESKPRTAVAVQVIVHGQATCFAGLSGLLKTARQENPQLLTQCISLDSVVDPATLRDIVVSNAQALDAHVVRYRTGQREVERLHDLAMASDSTADKPWKDTGVYLISGGLGGLGLVFAKDIAAHTANATVILSGRSALTAEHQAILDTLAAAGLTVEYHQADVADRAAVDQLIADIHGTHGALNGIIHSAGIINDNFILKKSTAELQQVLAPKVAGLIHLDEATQQQALDLFICFSSTSGAFGNPGQADYAAANAFMDQYAQYRQDLVGDRPTPR